MARLNVLADVVKGLKANIYAVDNLSPVSRVALYIRAGSRYEPDHVPGISHYIKASAGLTTKDSSIFGIARYLERNGASFKVSLEREHIIYRIDCLRDKLGNVLNFIDDTVHKPEYRPWELVDTVAPRLKRELQVYKTNQGLVSVEALHKAAYRGGLAHSRFVPEHQIGKIKSDDLHQYANNNFVLDRMFFVGLGVDQGDLRQVVEERFSLKGSNYAGVHGASRYIGGEARIQANFPETMVSFVVESCPTSDLKTQAVLEIIATILGDSTPSYLKYGDGPQLSLNNLLKKQSPSLRSSIIKINHSDTGLFGFSLIGPNEHLRLATTKAVDHVKKVVTNLNEKDLKLAKSALKARSFVLAEDHEAVFNGIGQRYTAGIVGQSSLDLVDKLTLKEVIDVAVNLLKKKPTITSVGNPRFVPYLDELNS